MRRADNGLRAEMVRRLKPLGFVTDSIESGATVSGVADASWCHVQSRKTGWFEAKATDGWAVKFRPHQISWLTRRSLAGDRVTVAVRVGGVGSSNARGDGLWLVLGAGAACLAAAGLDGLAAAHPEHVLGRWYGPPRSWDWSAVAELMLAG